MKSAYEQLTAITDGQDAVVEIRISALTALIDSSRIGDDSKQFVIDQAVEQLRKRVIVDRCGETSFKVRTSKPDVKIIAVETASPTPGPAP